MDVFGDAVFDYQQGLYTEDIITSSSLDEEDVIPLPYLFRDFKAMPILEQKALEICKGKILDIVVDIREDSPTFKKHFSIEISEDNKRQLFVPKGFAHGFLVLQEDTIINYKCDNFYHKDSECGIIFNDKDLNIDWGISENEIILSDKDNELPTLSAYLNEK